jgi:D-glycero-D-manno-heptose 1,7-bisphosphate phosphatase
MTPELVLLDRDGTLNAQPGAGRYVVLADEARLLPGAGDAVRLLNAANVPVVVVTNQRGLATGKLTGEQLDAVHNALTEQLAARGAEVAGWYVCPHDIGTCDCRKPLPGLLRQALSDRPGTAPQRCFIIGDAESDMLAGAALRVPGILLATNAPPATVAEAVRPSLLAAVEGLLHADPGHARTANPQANSPRAADC